jgi:diguanylate cyclase (GGDEF)-like protein
MPAKTVLLVDSTPGGLAAMEQALRGESYTLLKAGSREEALRALGGRDVQIILLAAAEEASGTVELVRELRATQKDVPVQVLLLAGLKGNDGIRLNLEAGSDDFLRVPWDPFELAARTRAAQIRWEAQATLVKEREFYRVAVAEEERLSSLVLDQNQNLKDAYEKIRRLNEELEKANRELERIAAYDSLSGLLNRRSLFSRIGIEIDRSVRLDAPLTGLMIDIDRFKSINDNYGHQCGDLVLRELGARLSAGLRKYDYAGRYGGEEFFVVLSNSNEEQALRIAERFRKDIEDCRFSCSGEQLSISVSIGVARFRQGETQEAWIDRADRALYQAKQAGRNRVVGASPVSADALTGQEETGAG